MAQKKTLLSANAMLGLGLAACAALVVVALVGSRFLRTEPPPPPPPPPPAPERSVTTLLRFTPNYFRAILEEDAQRFGLPKVDLASLTQPMLYADELAAPRTLKAGKDSLETAHLKLSTKVMKAWATSSGQGFRYEHTILQITNKTDVALAYRIETTPSQSSKCGSMGALPHNALALAPKETITRTECLWHPGASLTIKRVEVIELPALGYRYVSRLVPGQVLLEERTAAGHEGPKGKACPFIPWREILSSAEAGGTTWADVIDFYARHNCDEYTFWRGYRRWTAPGSLPSHAGVSAAPAKPVDRGP